MNASPAVQLPFPVRTPPGWIGCLGWLPLALVWTLVIMACGGGDLTAAQLPPLPTSNVPPLAVVDAAIRRWQAGENQRVFITVEETTQAGRQLIRLVVVDDQIRAAQRLDGLGSSMGPPEALPPEQAREYTVDALLARLRRDAAGQGPAPLNMRVVFDPGLGYPSVVQAEALPTYNAEGKIELNRQYSYELAVDVAALLEDTVGGSRTPWLTLTRSGGREARCEFLRIFSDGASVYADDCRQTLLQLRLPAAQLAQLETLSARFASLDDRRELDGEAQHLIIQGSAQGPGSARDLQAAWNLALELYRLLSRPIGTDLTLLYEENGKLSGLDLYSLLAQPAALDLQGALYGATLSSDGQDLAYADESGLRWLNLRDGSSRLLLASPAGGGHYLPRAWNRRGELLLTRVPAADGELAALGWLDVREKIQRPLPLAAGLESYGCDTGVAWDPQGARVVVAGLGYGEPCNTNPGLTLVDIDAGSAQLIVRRQVANGLAEGSPVIAGAHTPAWSPQGDWIAVALDEDATAPLTFPTRLYLVRPDGSDLNALTENPVGSGGYPVWSPQGQLFYSLSGVGPGLDGIYQFDPATREGTRLIAGEELAPLSVSPDGQFLAYQQGPDLQVWGFPFQQSSLVASGSEGALARFVGWISGPGD